MTLSQARDDRGAGEGARVVRGRADEQAAAARPVMLAALAYESRWQSYARLAPTARTLYWAMTLAAHGRPHQVTPVAPDNRETFVDAMVELARLAAS